MPSMTSAPDDRDGLFPQQQQRTGTLLDVVPSSRGEGGYELRIGADHKVYCTCPGWIHSRKQPKMCRHLSAWILEHSNVLSGVLQERVSKDTALATLEQLHQAAKSYDGKRS